MSGKLPSGLTLIGPFAPLTADINGVPTTQDLYSFVIKFTGSSGTVFAWPFVWQITPPAPIVISLASVPATGQGRDGRGRAGNLREGFR